MVADPGLTELQLEIMRVLWKRGAATVADVHAAMHTHELAHATIATLLRRMEKKGAVEHDKQGRQFVYRARISEEQARKTRVAEAADRLIRGQVPALIHYLLDQRKVSAAELAEVKALIEAKEREVRRRR
jgi:BlaI family transcriptional regulator, penicillinase repressor